MNNEQQIIDFLKTRVKDKLTISVGYISHLDKNILVSYRDILRLHDPSYVASFWCDDCNFKMAQSVWMRFGKLLDKAQTSKEENNNIGSSQTTEELKDTVKEKAIKSENGAKTRKKGSNGTR